MKQYWNEKSWGKKKEQYAMARKVADEQWSMDEEVLSIPKLKLLVERIEQLQNELEEKDTIAQYKELQRKELRETNKRLRDFIVELKLRAGHYRIGLTPWVMQVKNVPGATKEVKSSAHIQFTLFTIE